MSRANASVAIAILARAPVPGLAKTRLIPGLGAHGAAWIAERMIERALATAREADIGPVTLWCAPDDGHRAFRDAARDLPVALRTQPDGDLGVRMLAAAEAAAGPVLVVGTDCPALTSQHLREAADALNSGKDIAVIPAEDGGYVLIGMREPRPELFSDIPWSTDTVMAITRERIRAHGLSCREFAPLWDIDTPADYERLVDARLIEGAS